MPRLPLACQLSCLATGLSSPAGVRCVPLNEIKGLLPELAEGAPAQRQAAAVLPVELLYPRGGLILHVTDCMACSCHIPLKALLEGLMRRQALIASGCLRRLTVHAAIARLSPGRRKTLPAAGRVCHKSSQISNPLVLWTLVGGA